MSSTIAPTPTSRTSCSSGGALPLVPWHRFFAVLLAYALSIVLLTWPWLQTISSRVIDHWDPPFHAWKLHYAATQILSGHLLPPDGNTNMYYPHTGAFYYEALHWPQAVFAALLQAIGANSVATYHVTLVFFWALSGVLFWAFLRALGMRGIAAFLGGFAFTVMPYRISYVLEFNMQLSFGLPLFLFFAARFFQRPCVGYALGAALAWWLQATSELYQAIFLLFAVPFLAAALLSRDPSLLRSWRRFWLPMVVAAVVGGGLSLAFLRPYLTLLDSGSLVRLKAEILKHCLEPFSLFQPLDHYHLLPSAKAKHDEMSIYPTVTLLVAGFGYAIVAWRRRPSILRGLRDACLCLFAGVATAIHLGAHLSDPFLVFYSWLPVLCVVLSVPLLFDGRNAFVQGRVLAAMGVAGIFGFFMMFGPEFRDSLAPGIRPENHLFQFLFEHIRGLSGFRVVSRFCILPVLWICAVAACGAEALLGWKRKTAGISVLAALCVLFVIECVHKPIRTRPIRDVSHSSVIQFLDERIEPYVLAIVPMGLRDLDSEHMLQIAGTKRFSVYAWGGTYPHYTKQAQRSLTRSEGDPDRAAELLRQLWPEALVLEDRRPFSGVMPFDFREFFGPRVETLSEDGEFRLMRFRPDETERTEILRLVRHDMLAANPTASFALQSDAPARVWLDVNGILVGGWETGPESIRHRIRIPSEWNIRLRPNRFRFHADEGEGFRLTDFHLDSETGGVEAASEIDLEKPWLSYTSSISDDERLDPVHFLNGLDVVGAKFLGFNEWGRLRIRYVLRIPESISKIASMSLATDVTDSSGNVLFEESKPLLDILDANPCEAGVKDKYIWVEQTIHQPGFCRPGARYGLALAIRDSHGHRISGKDSQGRKVRRIQLVGNDFTALPSQN